MSSPRCRTAIVLTLLSIALAACSPRPAVRPGGDFVSREERSVYIALREVKASDDQRAKILAAYDESSPRLRLLGDEADELMQRWHSLNRRDPSFTQKAAPLTERWGAIERERMELTGTFESRVASALDADQWQQWQDFWMRGYGPGRGGEGADEGGPGEDRRRR